MDKLKLIIPIVVDSDKRVFVYSSDVENEYCWEFPILRKTTDNLKKDINTYLLNNFGIRVSQVSEKNIMLSGMQDNIDFEELCFYERK